MRFQVNVSQYDIDNSKRGTPHDCMISNAFMRATDGGFSRDEVYVDAEKGVGWYIHICRLPEFNLLLFLRKLPGGERLDQIIEAWDAGYTVEPFTFWIDLPEVMLQLPLFEHVGALQRRLV